ncbi:MAG: outer membrane protein [Methylovirgula sp.]
MSIRTSILCGLMAPVAAALCAATPAEAADLGSFFSSPQPDVPTQPVEFGTGWYIRGDGAWAADSLPQISPDLTQFVTNSRQTMFNADLGFGYKLNNWIRADIVADYWLPTRAQGLGASAVCTTQLTTIDNIPTVTAQDDCTPHENSEIQRLDALANLYVDLGTWSGFTPYVGGGIGVSRIQITSDTNWYMSNGLPYHITTDGFYFNWDRSIDLIRYQFAWALMAGVSYAITPELALDVGYRYINLGTISGIQDATGNSYSKVVDAHEVRLGLRYLFDQ